MSPRFILAVTDFSAQGDNALARAALLCAEHGAALKLACIRWPGETSPADAATRLAHHARQLAQAHRIPAQAASRHHRSLEDLRAEIGACDLVVWGAEPSTGLRSFFLGQPVEALVRSAGRPVLVVQNSARRPYRSLLVAVDFTPASVGLVGLGSALGSTASLELFHAVSTANEGKLRYAMVATSAIQAYRDHCRSHAKDRMFRFTDSFDARRNRVHTAIAHGDPAYQTWVQQERSGSELVVVGKHPRSAFSEMVFGSVAARLLRHLHARDGGADVLVVPHGWQPSMRASAARRLAAERPLANRVRAGAPPQLSR